MLKLNLPPTEIPLQRRGDTLYVWDHLRKRMIKLTPEEWVRQNFTRWMINDLHYPATHLAHEVSLSINGMTKRCDAVFYNSDMTPRIILEFKAPHINITQRTFNQISRYNMVMHVPMLIISNGIQHYCLQVDYQNETYSFLDHIPMFS